MEGIQTQVPLDDQQEAAARRWWWCRLVLLVGMVGLFVAMLLTGTRPASLQELDSRLSSGSLSQVELVGALSLEAQGGSLVEIRWHDGLLPRYTEVWQESSGTEPDGSVGYANNDDLPVVRGDVVESLTAQTPDGRLSVTDGGQVRESHGSLYDWKVPVWLALVGMAGALAALVMLITGQEPRLATRWAWFWLFVGTGFLATVVYLVLGVRRPGQGPPESRLTGGWAFLVMLVIQATWPWWTHG
ncbi:hypothetical protein [Serinicoccus sp. LYQ131]|uniref:hypothetical protein n=1 Tax=Serinicoccus sp. LYQ131 TaxID=3378797 RepID=UPI003855394E